MGGWFHQDYDLAGETVAEVTQAFAATASAAQCQDLRRDVARFVSDHAANLDQAFAIQFKPDVDPLAFASSTREFLRAIERALPAAGSAP